MDQQSLNYQGDEFSLYLENALNPDMNIRKQAEDKINSFCDQNFGQFLLELSKKISTEQEKKIVRQMSAVLIKNMLNKEGYSAQWFNLNDEAKTLIKNNILSTLASNDIDIRKSAALTVAGICKLEIPAKQWLNIFTTLSSTSQNENLNIQLSSLNCLEYIFEEIKQSDIPLDIVANLLNTFYTLLNKDAINEDLGIYSLKAILKFLPFIKEFVKDLNQRKKFYDLIDKYIRHKNQIIREFSLKIFIELARLYYDTFENYIENIFNFSVPIIKEDVENNKILCMEIWATLGCEEDYRLNSINQVQKQSLGFLQKYNIQLSELCLEFIVTEDYYNDEYNVSFESYYLLSIMSRTCKNEFLQNMINYIAKSMSSENQTEKLKYSGLNVFRAIIHTIYKEDLYPVVKDSLGMISQILIENSYPAHFKKLCAFILKAITKNFGDELVSDTIFFNKMIQLFVGLLNNSTKEVLYHLLMALNSLCKSVTWNENDQTNVLSKHIQTLCEKLLPICQDPTLYDKDYNIILVAFYLLGTLGERSALDVKDYMTNFFKTLTEMFAKTLKVETFPNIELAYNYQEYLASTLSGFLITGKATPYCAENLLNNIIETFKMRKSLYEEGISLIGGICNYIRDEFKGVMELISPYIIQGLKSTNSYSICKASILCLSDIVLGLGNQNKYIADFLPLIMNILSDNNIDRDLKSYCFNIISDLFISCQQEIFKYFDSIMNIIKGAMEATKESLSIDTDTDTINHFIDLREHILETVSCIFSAIKDISKTKEFIPFVNGIIQYINLVSSDSLCCSLSILSQGLFLIADFCMVYRSDLNPLLNRDNIKNMIYKIENDKNIYKDQKFIQGLNWAKNCLNNVLGMNS